MTTYIAFLRGINVGAHNRVKMDELRASFESLGYDRVETYIQSGNVVFETAETDPERLRTDVARAIEEGFGYDVTVVIRTRAELEAVVERRPFDDPTDEAIKHYVTFLRDEPTAERVDVLSAAQNDAERFEVRGREVYSELDKSKLERGRFTDAGEKLQVPATRRTWNVVTAVLNLSRETAE